MTTNALQWCGRLVGSVLVETCVAVMRRLGSQGGPERSFGEVRPLRQLACRLSFDGDRRRGRPGESGRNGRPSTSSFVPAKVRPLGLSDLLASNAGSPDCWQPVASPS